MPPTPDSATGTDDLAELLVRAARALRRGWAAAVEPWDLSPHQARALGAVGQDRGLRPSDLARRLRIAPRSATEVVDALAERGLVRREACPGDRRAVMVTLTPAGRAVHGEVEAARAGDARAYFAHLGPDGREHLAVLLRALVEERPRDDAAPGTP